MQNFLTANLPHLSTTSREKLCMPGEGGHYHIKQVWVKALIINVRGTQWGKNNKKEGFLGEKWNLIQKRGLLVTKLPKQFFFFFYKFCNLQTCHFWSKIPNTLCDKCNFLIRNSKDMGPLGDKSIILRGLWVRSELKNRVLEPYIASFECGGAPHIPVTFVQLLL